MIQIKKLDHLVLLAQDLDRMVRFYCDVLGCTVERKTGADGGLVQLRAGEGLIDILAGDSAVDGQGNLSAKRVFRNMDHFCLRVEPFSEPDIRQYLSQHGVTASELKQVYGAEGVGPALYLHDPEGNSIELKGPSQRVES